MRTHLRGLGRGVAATATIGAGILLAASPASAHVGIGAGDYHADSYVVVPFNVPHGCDGSPTTKIRIQLPESIPTVTPTVNPGWDINLVKEQLATPLDIGEGRTLTERITEVDYTAKAPLPNEYRDVMELSLHLPADAAGKRLDFPVIQECVEGSTDWTMIPTEGQDAEELEHPAPSIEVEAAEAEGDHHDDEEQSASPSSTVKATTTTTDDADSGDDNGSDRGLAIAGLATGVVGMALGGRALAASKGSSGGSASS